MVEQEAPAIREEGQGLGQVEEAQLLKHNGIRTSEI